MSKDFIATIRQESARAEGWLEVFGTYEVSLQSPIPEIASAPGIYETLFYRLDLTELTQEQRLRLISFIARWFDLDEKGVSEALDEVGCPILADDISITVFNPQKWIGE